MSGIYMHIPFCRKACHYCNFHFSTNLNLVDELVDAMVHELHLRQAYIPTKKIESIYFGGGTPSVLDKKHFDILFDKIFKDFWVDPSAEITLEANPDDLNADYLKMLTSVGVNRLSIGVQSFYDDDLSWMNRSHNAQQAEASIQEAQDIGIDNISIDLIFGCPTGNLSKWKSNLHKVDSLHVRHLSCYGLTVEDGTALKAMIKSGKYSEPKEEEYSEQFLETIKIMEGFGFVHYEISNYCKEGAFAVHNSNYWKSIPYLGIGPSAHSFDGHSRQWNISHNKKYIDALKSNEVFYEKEILTEQDRTNEYLMTGLRTIWGCELKRIKELHEASWDLITKELSRQISLGHVINENGIITLTSKGKLIANNVISELFVDTDGEKSK